MISLEFFLAICSSLWIGVKLTIFFKRRFRWRDHFFSRLRLNSVSLILIIAAQFLLPIIIARLDSANLILIIAAQFVLQMITAVIAMVSAITDMYLMMTNLGELVKSLVLGACIIVSWKIERGSYILPLSSLFFALTQFLRWPKGLKDFLSEVRIVCGPAFPLPVVATWLKRSEPSGSSFWVFLVAVLFSSVAAIFFRPDNSEVLVLFHLPVLSSRNRKVCHAVSSVWQYIFHCIKLFLAWTFNVFVYWWSRCACVSFFSPLTPRVSLHRPCFRATVTVTDNNYSIIIEYVGYFSQFTSYPLSE